jgi:hypothetical protein
MSPQAAITLQQATAPVSVKQSVTGDVLNRIQQSRDSIARRAFEIFDNNGRWPGHDLEDWLRAESEQRLTITGKHETQEESKKGRTIGAKQILRAVDLPAEIDTSKVSAILTDGILKIELPKAVHVKGVRIESNTA